MKRQLLILLALLCCGGIMAQNKLDNRAKFRKAKKMSYEEFVKATDSTYTAFLDSINKEYAEFMRKVWKEGKMKDKVVKPKDDQQPPVIYVPPTPKPEPKPAPKPKPKPKQDSVPKPEPPVVVTPKDTPVVVTPKDTPVVVAPIDTPVIEIPVIVMPTPEPVVVQPEPVVTIPENDEANGYHTFTYLGTQMKARWGDADKFHLEGDDENAFANAFLDLTKKKYNNLYNDVLKLREDYQLCDWAYYQMLGALSEAACGKGTEEAVFMQGVILVQTGYKLRFGYDANHRLHLLIKTANNVYGHTYISEGGDNFYLLDNNYDGSYMHYCNKAFPGEKGLALDVNTLPNIAEDRSAPREIKSDRYDVAVTVSSNKNLMPFFASYPTSYSDDNIMTRWAYYANAPLETATREALYPQLKEAMGNADQRLKVNMLLNWIQTGLKYELDDKVWGEDRAFFPDESLYYPFCDCEDRAILLTRLVRDLMGLDCILVFYPGHLACAVNFTEEVHGDYIMVNGRKFVIADPTYINAPVGRTMPGMDNQTSRVILLRK